MAALAATLFSCGTLSCGAAERAIDGQNEPAPPADSNELAAADGAGATRAPPRRWICEDGTSVNFEFSSPHWIVFDCATLKDLIDEFNRYSTTWHFTYSGPDSGHTLVGLLRPDRPGEEETLLDIFKRDFGVKVKTRDASTHTIALKPLTGTKEPAPRPPAPRSLNVDREWDGRRRGSEDCDDIQFDDGRGGVWCRYSTLGRLLTAFNRHNEWQLSLVDTSLSEYAAHGLFAYDDLDGLLRYLKMSKLVEGSRAIDLHQIRLVRRPGK